jgi:hypothetical protein
MRHDSTLDIDGAERANMELIKKSLKKLKDPIITRLFVSIVNLIQHFCKHGASETNEIYYKISNGLNDLGREDALFSALEILDD